MAQTLLLDVVTWDLALDTSGNIAVARAPYARAQDAASAIRTFLGEVYYDTAKGVPYFQQILGRRPPLSLLKSKLTAAALTVPGLLAAKVYITAWTDRAVRGQVHVTDVDGITSVAGF